MEVIIHRYDDGETLSLTTESPASHYGIPALRYSGCGCPDMGPADNLCTHAWGAHARALFGECTAAYTVKRFATAETEEVCRHFLQQWPEGPQI